MYFSIAAPQQVTLPDGTVLSFRVNAQDSSLCEIHVLGVDGNDAAGTHILSFKRNGSPADTTFVATPKAPGPPQPKEVAPLAGFKSVDDDAVRTDASAPTPPAEPVDTPPAA